MNQNHITALNEIANIVHSNAVEHGFHDFDEDEGQYVTRACMLKVTEVAELFEAYRNNKLTEPCDKSPKMLEPLTNEEEELADVIIRALDFSRRRGINIGRAVMIKHVYNKNRPYRHGGKAA